MLARYLVAGAAAVLMFYCSTCLASADYKQENQLLSREKRGIALSSTGLATIAGGLMGMLSIMGLPKLRRRVGQIGELRDFRAVAKPRFENYEVAASEQRPVVMRCVYRLGPSCIYSVPRY